MSILGLFPLINEGISSISNFSSILGMFIFYYAITIPFDIRDSNKDDKALKTIPQALGIEKAKYFAISLLLFSYIFATFNYNTRIQILFLGIFIICGLLIFKTTIASQWFHYALIDLCIAGLGLALIFG
jgi:4-hydroxybenzoate polyprenyltransferase